MLVFGLILIIIWMFIMFMFWKKPSGGFMDMTGLFNLVLFFGVGGLLLCIFLLVGWITK